MPATPRKTVKKARPDLHDCAKGRMHDAPLKVVTTMPGGYIA